jgi:dTDP-4-amino-4,6-dideoxygalactose transaminase
MKSNRNDAFQDKSIKVPFVVPNIDNSDKKAVITALESNLLTGGPTLRKFENSFRDLTGSKYAIGVSNATAALQLSLKSLKIGKDDEVIIPDMTFVATANAVLFTGATPILADINFEDLNISVESIKKNMSSKTKAIIPVHFAGKSCNMKEIRKIAKQYHVKIIEDCAHAVGTKFGHTHVGNFGEAGCFSFYPTKNLTTIEGGMIITNSFKTAQYIMKSRNHGISRTLKERFSNGLPWDYEIFEMGYNFRLDEIRSCLGVNQLKRIKKMNKLRRIAADYYTTNLRSIKGIITPKLNEKSHSWHLYVIKIQKEFGTSRDELFKKLLANGVRTSVHYKPLHKFSLYKKMCKKYGKLTNSSKAYKEILSLPLYPGITKKEQDYVIKQIIK